MWVLVLIVVLLVVIWGWKSTLRPEWLPKGPALMPFVGHFLSVDIQHPWRTFLAWSRRYGSVYYVQIGAQPVVIISDPDVIRETFSNASVMDRPSTAPYAFYIQGAGIIASCGSLWQHTRRFTLHHLRNLGMGRYQLEHVIHDEVACFKRQVLQPNCGRAFDLGHFLNASIVNIIWYMIASERLDISDTTVLDKVRLVDEVCTTDIEPLQYHDFFPILGKLLVPWLFDEKKVMDKYADIIDNLFGPALIRHRANIDWDSEPKDYLDALLQEQRKHPEEFTDHHIFMCIQSLFFAGNDTTATAMRWSFCFLCNHPETQRRIRSEINSVTGGTRAVCLEDRLNMPYTDAFIHETQRRGDILPMGVPHVPSSPVNIAGHVIPPGVMILANHRFVHRSNDFFPDAMQFRPERFLDAKGRFHPDKNVMPFSTGKRRCVGESLARMELFIFLTHLLQGFEFRWPSGFHHDLSEDCKMASLVAPTMFKIVFEPIEGAGEVQFET